MAGRTFEGMAGWVRENRKAAGLTQQAVAEFLGIHQGQVSEIERGLAYPWTRSQVEEFAAKTGADCTEGLRLAGYDPIPAMAIPSDLPDDIAALCKKFARLAPEMQKAIRVMIEAATVAA